MKNFNYFLYILGGIFVAYIFYSFLVGLGMFAYNLGKPVSALTRSELNYFYITQYIVTTIGFFVGFFSFRHILKD